jgi:hypothetical protein
MNQVTASWEVYYKDGSSLNQNQDGEHVPFHAIEWAKVETLIFESQLVRQTFSITPCEEGETMALRSRHFMAFGSGGNSMCFMLVRWDAKDDQPDDDNTKEVLYWMPNGTVHHCQMFNCPDVSEYGSNVAHNADFKLMPNHGKTIVATDAALIQ